MADWNRQMMLDFYIYDYMIRNNMHAAAEIFAREANIQFNNLAVNPPEGFLSKWWSEFLSMYSARISAKHEATDGVSSKALQSSERVRTVVHPSTIVRSRDVNHMIQRPGFSNALQTAGEMTMLRPHAGNFLQKPPTTTMSRPELNLNWFRPVLVSGPSTELMDTMHELERHEPPFDQFAHLLPSSINCSHLQDSVCRNRRFGSNSLSISNAAEPKRPALRPTDHTDARMRAQEHFRLFVGDLNLNAELLNVDQIARLLAYSRNQNNALTNVLDTQQLSVANDDDVGTSSSRARTTEAAQQAPTVLNITAGQKQENAM